MPRSPETDTTPKRSYRVCKAAVARSTARCLPRTRRADTVYGRGGDDRIIAGSGSDTVYGGAGADHVYSADLVDAVIDDDYEMIVAPVVVVPQSGPEASDDWQHVDVAQSVTIDV